MMDERTQNPEVEQQECPVCQAILPVYTGYVTWCDQCEWNVNPQQPERPRNIFESVYGSLGQKQSQALFDQFVRAESLKPTFTASRFLAFVLAVIVHGVTLAFAILGVVLLILGWPYLFAILGGLLCIGIAWVLRPRFPKPSDTIVSRQEFPTLYKFVDTIAISLDTSEVDGVVVNERFTAAFSQIGWQRKKVVHLGLPLWTILDDQEKVALVAHELAHSVNSDANRSLFISTAIGALANWYALLYPDYILAPGSGIYGIFMIPLKLAMLGLAGLARLGAYVLSHLLWRDSQRAEYLADYLAATVSGTDAMLSVLEKLHLSRTFALTLQRATLSRNTNQNLFRELRQRIAMVPQRELERIKRVQQLKASRLDVTHPPTTYRIKLLQAHRVSRPKVIFLSTDLEQVDSELSAMQEKVQQKLIDMYRASLYH